LNDTLDLAQYIKWYQAEANTDVDVDTSVVDVVE
jgi:hypothetical protein